MNVPVNVHGRRRGRGIRSWLIALNLLGLTGFLGGLVSLAALGQLGPEPATIEGWTQLRAAVRSIFVACVLTGLMIAVAAGLALLLQMPRVFLRLRWFRVKAIALVVLFPTLHVWARGRVMALDEAIEAGGLEVIADRWAAVSRAFLVALMMMLLVALLGRIKPRLEPRYGAARKRSGDQA